MLINRGKPTMFVILGTYLVKNAMSRSAEGLGKYCCLATCFSANKGPSTSVTGLNFLSSDFMANEEINKEKKVNGPTRTCIVVRDLAKAG